MTLSRKSSLIPLLMLSLLIAVLAVHADDLPTAEPAPISTSLPTEEPTLAPVEPTVPTAEATDSPTLAPTDIPTIEVISTQEAPVLTPTASETEATQAAVVLPLAYSTNFDADYPPELSPTTQWISVAVIGGKALQAAPNADAITYTRASFLDGAVEARFLINAGEGQVLLDGYKAGLNTDGLLTLTRNETSLATYQAALTAGEWSKVRLQAAAGRIQVSLNDSLVIDIADSAPLVEGFAGFAASSNSALRVDDFAVYGTPITVYAPAIVPTDAPTDISTAVSTEQPADIPTVVSTEEPTVAPTAETTTEPSFALPAAMPGLPGALPQSGETITLTSTYNLANKITLTWNDLSSEENYDIESSFDGGATWTHDATVAANVTTYDITGLTCGDHRLVRVRGYVNTPSYSELAVSNTPQGWTTACAIIDLFSPANNTTFVDDSTPLLRWTAVAGAYSYQIDLSSANQFFSQHVVNFPWTVSDNTFYVLPDLPNGTYYWRVKVSGSQNGQTGTWSTPVRSFILNNLPAPTYLNGTTNQADTITLTWSDITGEDGYLIEQSPNNITWSPLATTAVDVTSYDMTGLQCGYRSPKLRVRAFSNSPSYRTSSATSLTDPFAYTTPCSINIISPDDNAVFSDTVPTFAWDAAPNTLYYQLSLSPGGAPYGYPRLLTGTSYLEDALPNGTYTWSVRVNSIVEGLPTTTRTFTLTDRPNPVIPNGFRASKTFYDKVRLQWDDVSGEGGYVIEESPDGVTWTHTATLAQDVTLYDVTTLTTCDPSPYYRVRAVSALNSNTLFHGAVLSAAERGSLLCPVLQAPVNNSTVMNNQIQFNWLRMDNVDSYLLDLSTSPTFDTSLDGYPIIVPYNPLQGGSNFSYDLDNALPVGVYYWRVRTNMPTQSVYSATFKMTVHPSTIPDTPVPLLPTTSGFVRTTRPTFSWQPVADASVYWVQVDDDPNFKSPNFKSSTNQTTLITTAMVGADFTQGVQYWRVRSMYSSGSSSDEGYSAWSQPKQFTVNPALTPVDRFVAVPVGAATTAKVDFTWDAHPDPLFPPPTPPYTVEVDDDPGFESVNYYCSSPLATVKTCSLPAVALGAYYWRVIRSDETPYGTPVYNRLFVSVAVPRAPTLTTPINNKILQPAERPNVTLAWNWGTLAAPTGGPFTYDVEVSTSSTFNIEAADSAAGWPPASPYPTAALADGKYYWHVRAVNTYGVPGAWSAPFSFVVDSVPPAPPTITLPALNATVPTARPTFTWVASAGAVRYGIEVRDGSCSGTLLYPLNTPIYVTTTTYTIPASAPALSQGTQVVCITPYDASGNGNPASTVRPFTVFLGLTPAANIFTLKTAKLVFTWTAAPVTAGYTLQIENALHEDVYHVSLGSVTTYTLPASTLANDGLYYWRVVRTDEVFTTEASRVFYVGSLLPGPVLNSPINNPTINTPTSLSWNAASAPAGADITGYQVEISKAATFLPALSSTTITLPHSLDTLFTPLDHTNAVRHYWRVRGLVNGAPVTNWSSSSFTVDTELPGIPVVSSPLPNALLNTVRPAITWAVVPGATKYRVSIQDSVTSVYVVPEQTVTGLSLPLTASLPQSDLILRVRAEDTINAGAWRTVNFRVRLGTAPAQNGVVTLNRPTFSWLAVPEANSYILQIDDDPLFDGTVDAFTTLSIPLGKVLTYTLKSTAPADPALPANHAYYWRVKADVAVDYPANTASRTFYFMAATATKPGGLAALANGVTPVSSFNKTTYLAGGVTLSWTNITPAPLSYAVEVSTSATFAAAGTTSYPVPVSLLPTSSLQLTGNQLTDGAKYWRVRAIYSTDQTGYGVWSDVKSFILDQVAPSAPTIPASTSTTYPNRPTFTWAVSLTATQYYLTVVGTSIDHLPVTGTSYKMPTTSAPLTQNTNGYTWFVEAADAYGNRSDPSLDQTLYVFVGLTPTYGQFVTILPPKFTWTPVTGTGAAPWFLQVATDQDMTQNVYTSPQLLPTAATFTLPANTVTYGRYYWRVYRQGESLANLRGQVFYITNSLPNVIAVPQYPANGSTIGQADVTDGMYTQWKTIPSNISLLYSQAYLFELSTSPTFTSLVDYQVVQGNSNYPVNAFLWDNLPVLDGKTYYWRVRGLFGAVDLGPNPTVDDYLALDFGPVSATYSFKVDLTPPTTPTLMLPVVNAVVTTTRTPIFTWTAAARAPARYRVEISTDSGFASIDYTASTTTPVLALMLPAYQALPNGTYYWRVVALDLVDNESLPTVSRRFTVNVP